MPKNNEPQEQLEFLKREEVRTMAKDIAQLHEGEAEKERERITKIKTESAPPSEGAPGRMTGRTLAPSPPSLPPSLMPHEEKGIPVLPKIRTRFDKILIRAIVMGVLLFILLNGLAFGYWYFTKKRVLEITPSPQPTPTTEIEEPIIQLPTPASLLFFDVAQEKTIALGATDNLLLLLSGTLKEEYAQGFTRILVPLTTREFLNTAGVAMPEPLLALLKDDFMLFVYSSPARKRLGIITELSKTEGAQDMLRSWETTLEQDTKPLWEIVGQKGSAYTPLFRQATYQNTAVRFQTFSAIDFGVVYTLFGTKLILTTSFESLTRAIDQIIQSR